MIAKEWEHYREWLHTFRSDNGVEPYPKDGYDAGYREALVRAASVVLADKAHPVNGVITPYAATYNAQLEKTAAAILKL